MSNTIKSTNKYVCTDREKLKEYMKEEGFIFKNSAMENDEFFVDLRGSILANDTCIRVRRFNDKEVRLSYESSVDRLTSLNINTNVVSNLDIYEYGNIVSFLMNLGYYKYVTLEITKETYVKKEKEFYYSISIDKINGVGEFVDFDIYTDSEDEAKTKVMFDTFENQLTDCLGEVLNKKYRDFCSEYFYNNLYKGAYLKKILVEIDKILIDLDLNNIEDSIKNTKNILNLELIEKLEQQGINVQVIYSTMSEEDVQKLKIVLSKIGYNPKLLNIKQIKEISVRETLILEKQKKVDFSEVALIVINNR